MPAKQLDRRHAESIALAAIGILAVADLRRGGESLTLLSLEFATIILCMVATLFGFWLSKRSLRVIPVVVMLLAPLAFAFIARIAGEESAYEMTMLTVLGAAALAMATFNRRVQAMSLVAAGFLTLFATVISDRTYAVAIAIIWMTICLWHLVANHWERIDRCAVVNVSRVGTTRWMSVAAACFLLIVGVVVSQGRFGESRRFLWGFMPTSGGSQWSDPGARKGVGTGDIAVSAKDNADSFGAVDSDVFLESTQLSLFDMVSDALGEPKISRNSDRRQSLTEKNLIQTHHQASKSEKGGGASFAIERQAPRKHLHLSDALENAIVQWAGPTGVRLAMQRYDHFDGADWHNESKHEDTNFTSQQFGEETWIMSQGMAHRLNSSDPQVHQATLKVLRLKSARVPTPMMTAAIHVKDVDRRDFFALDNDGSYYMPGRKKVPPTTVIHIASLGMLEDELIERVNQRYPLVQAKPGDETLDRLTRAWTADCGTSYERLRAIVDHLRTEFHFDRNAEFETDNQFEEFLSARRGGDHLFATTAALMAKKLGFEARLVSGFYVRPSALDLAAAHSNVAPQDVHTWVEIQLDTERWVALEPTPGYREPIFRPSLWLTAKRFAAAYWPWALLFAGAIGLLYGTRLIWLGSLLSLAWKIGRMLSPRRRITLATWVIETRAKLLGHARPVSLPHRDWLLDQVVRPARAEADQREIAESFCDVADRFVFGNLNRLDKQALSTIDGVVRVCSMTTLKRNLSETPR